MREEPHRLVFVDECGTRTNMTRLRGRARRGARVRDHAPLRHKGTQTFVAGLRYDRLVAPWLLDGPMNRAAFDVWVETQLAPEVGKGDVVMLNSSSASPRSCGGSGRTRDQAPLLRRRLCFAPGGGGADSLPRQTCFERAWHSAE